MKVLEAEFPHRPPCTAHRSYPHARSLHRSRGMRCQKQHESNGCRLRIHVAISSVMETQICGKAKLGSSWPKSSWLGMGGVRETMIRRTHWESKR